MAVAVKHNQDTSSTGILERLPVALFMGVLYVFGCIGILFPLLDSIWWRYFFPDRSNPVAWVALLAVGTLLAGLLVWVGLFLLGPKPARGLRAGIILTAVGTGLLALASVYLGLAIEEWIFVRGTFGDSGHTVGMIIAGVVAGVLLLGFFWLVVQPRSEKFFGEVEDQGWFSFDSYKRNQGQKVRRGTMIGILLIIGFGLTSLNKTLERDPGNWNLHIPFTGKVRVSAFTAGDNPAFKDLRTQEWDALNAEAERLHGLVADNPTLKEQAAQVVSTLQKESNLTQALVQLTELRMALLDQRIDTGEPASPIPGGNEIYTEVDRFALRDMNKSFESNWVKVESAGFAGAERQKEVEKTFYPGAIVQKSVAEEEKTKRAETRKKLEEDGQVEAAELIQDPKTVEVKPATGEPEYYTLTLLPTVQYTLPALLALITLWFAWRIVNQPTFADFLIATEAELNKVSWVTRRQLYQDTIVVLVTVVLMTIFLLLADIGWSQFLKGIGVLHSGSSGRTQAEQELKW